MILRNMQDESPPSMTAVAPHAVPDSAATQNTDRAAVALSLLCIAHCLALPVLALALPILAVVGEMEWVHWVFATLAILASSAVATISPAARTPGFLIPAGLGVALIVFGLFADAIGIEEAIPTVIGGLLLAFAHWRRLST